jgi:ferritin
MNNQMMNMLNQLRQNPMQILSKRFNLPQNLPNNPQDIIQHLLNTGQINQSQVNNAMQMKKQFFGN